MEHIHVLELFQELLSKMSDTEISDREAFDVEAERVETAVWTATTRKLLSSSNE